MIASFKNILLVLFVKFIIDRFFYARKLTIFFFGREFVYTSKEQNRIHQK